MQARHPRISRRSKGWRRGKRRALDAGLSFSSQVLVLIFGRRSAPQEDLLPLQQEIIALKESVEAQSAEIRLLREKLSSAPKPAEGKDKGEGKEKE